MTGHFAQEIVIINVLPVVECLPLDPAAQVRFPPRAVGIYLHPVTHRISFIHVVTHV